MESLSHHNTSTLLSQYLDGVLTDVDRKRVEDLIGRDPIVMKEFNQLKRIRSLLSEQRKLEPNPAFWTRLSTSVREHPEEDNLLPFSRKYFPTAAFGSVIGIFLIGLVIFQNRMSLLHFVTQKSQMVQSVYEEGILKGSILPLLAHIDNNQVLQFSLLGVLPLDAKQEMALKVDQNAANGYQIKIGKTVERKAKPISVKEFYAEIQATKQQQDVIDSLVGLARKRMESSMLVGENEAVAIDPALAQLNRVMVSNIAACLEPFQRVRFGRFLEKRDAPYSFVSKKFLPANPESIYVEMGRIPSGRKFMVFTPDTMTFSHIDAEMIRQAQRSAEVSVRIQGVEQRNLEVTENLLRRFAERRIATDNMPVPPPRSFEVWKDANNVGIQIGGEIYEPRFEVRQPVVVPMPRRIRTYSMTSPTSHFEFGIYGDSVTAGEIMIDSAMTKFFKRNTPVEYNLRMMDSIFSVMNSQFQTHPGMFSLDSVLRTFEDARRRVFEENKKHQQDLQKEVHLRRNSSDNRP